MKQMDEKTISTRTVFEGRIIRVETLDVELETGQHAYRELVRHQGAVAVIARRPDGRFLFVKQFRTGSQQIMLEVVAGILEKGEDPEACARRELKEETGYDAISIRSMGHIFPTPGYVDEKIRVFFAETGDGAGERELDHDERLEVVALSADEFRDLVRCGEVTDAKTLAMWMLFETMN
jgi:ADP-ribose pyrophosphatase